MKEVLIASIDYRLATEISSQNPLKYLLKLNVEEYIDNIISTVYLYTRVKRGNNKTIFLAEMITAIGHNIRTKYRLKRDSGLAAKTGAFFLYSFEQLGMLEVTLGQASNGHATYIIKILDDDQICELWSKLGPSQIEKLPSEKPFAPWTSTKHQTGLNLVKTGNSGVLDKITPETHPIIFDCINKAQQVGWRINKDIFELYQWALKYKTEAFSDIWELQDQEAKATKIREAKTIGAIAEKFLNKTFYHIYYYDFRGRKYPATAYLHEQGSDLARGMLLRADKKAVGKTGFFWLCVSIASSWAGSTNRSDKAKTDKIPLKDRFLWTLENEPILLSYALSPKVNQGWMKADKPWEFLAAVFELSKLRQWQEKNGSDNYDYESSLECYIDGSNNGSQHLAALTKDEITAPHVNLVPLEMPGDLYKYVAEHVWTHIDSVVKSLSINTRNDAEVFLANLIELKKKIINAEPKSDSRRMFVEELRTFKKDFDDLYKISAPLFWSRITDSKERRKIVKRNTMTLPYGGTAYGLGQQQIDDARKHNIDLLLYMEHRWGAYLGREIYEDCRLSLRRPMQLLSVFEEAGRKAEQEGRFLSWTVPVTNFPVVQNYTEGKVKKVWVQYGPQTGERLSTGYFENTLQLSICFIEDTKPSKGKQSQGASPNAIHSLDAAHLALTVYRCDFPVTTIHDSFGCLLADMGDLYRIVRECFVELYKHDPLKSLMKDIDGDLSAVEIGNLDINLILQSEYCFS